MGVFEQSGGGGGITSIATANGFSASVLGGVATLAATPVGVLKSNGTALSAASGADFNTVATMTAGAPLVNGNVVYLATADGKLELTDADAEATSAGLIAMTQATVAEDATGSFLLRGFYTTSGLTPGATYYLSTTPGAITSAAPSAAADIVRVVGYALSSTVLYFNPDNTYIEIA